MEQERLHMVLPKHNVTLTCIWVNKFLAKKWACFIWESLRIDWWHEDFWSKQVPCLLLSKFYVNFHYPCVHKCDIAFGQYHGIVKYSVPLCFCLAIMQHNRRKQVDVVLRTLETRHYADVGVNQQLCCNSRYAQVY